jgi:hypothetical protein
MATGEYAPYHRIEVSSSEYTTSDLDSSTESGGISAFVIHDSKSKRCVDVTASLIWICLHSVFITIGVSSFQVVCSARDHSLRLGMV